jgi:hypothetical protein
MTSIKEMTYGLFSDVLESSFEGCSDSIIKALGPDYPLAEIAKRMTENIRIARENKENFEVKISLDSITFVTERGHAFRYPFPVEVEVSE